MYFVTGNDNVFQLLRDEVRQNRGSGPEPHLSMSSYTYVAYEILTVLDDNHYRASPRNLIQQGKVLAKKRNNNDLVSI